MTKQVIHVRTDNSHKDCRCITRIKTSGDEFTREQAHQMAKPPSSLHVRTNDGRVEVVPHTRDGLKYIRTSPNDTPDDNLLALPRF